MWFLNLGKGDNLTALMFLVVCMAYLTLAGYHYNYQDTIVGSVNEECSSRFLFNTFLQTDDPQIIKAWLTFVLSSATCSLLAALIAMCSIMCNVVLPMRLWFFMNPIFMIMNLVVVMFVSSWYLLFLVLQVIFYAWTFTWHKSVESKSFKFSSPDGLDSISSQHI